MNTEHFGNYVLRNLVSRMDAKTGAIGGTAMLYDGAERVAAVVVHAKDASVELQFKGNAHEYRFLRHIANLPCDAFEASFADRRTAAALFILELFDRGHEAEWLRKRCRDGTVFRVAGDPQDEWRVANVRFSDKVARKLRKAAGEAIECIANERLATA